MDKLQEIRARCEATVKSLRELLPPQTDYAEMVCAPAWAYGQHYIWEDPEPYAMDNAAKMLEEMLARLAALQAENERLREAQRCRHDVQTFANAMEDALKKHDDRPGWGNESIGYLYLRLQEELDELSGVLDQGTGSEICHELVDVANFCMMLYCNLKRAAAPEKGRDE